MISIISLIYKSKVYADSVWDSVHLNTKELLTGDAEFFFIANNASNEVLNHLDGKEYSYTSYYTHPITEEDLAKKGYDSPAYLHHVYKAWNFAIHQAGEIVVLVNSDHCFSPGWLTALLSQWDPSLALAPLTFEPGNPKLGTFGASINGTGSLKADFGRHPDNFDMLGFEAKAKKIAKENITLGGVYMPIIMSREKCLEAGLYPEGNPKGGYGDRVFFEKLRKIGVGHRTYHGSVVYHFQEGEMSE